MNNKISKHVQKINEYYKEVCSDWTQRERLLGRTTKLNEEVEELCEAALFEIDPVQQHKTNIDFDSELADVMIVTLLLAQDRDKNIWKEVEQKLEKQIKKYNINQ